MSQNTGRLAGVIFDMDGVLCDSERFIAEAACQMFAQVYSVTIRPEDFVPFVGMGEDRYLGGVAAKYGVQLDIQQDKERTYTIYAQVIKGRLQPLPGVTEFVGACRQRGLELAVATSADRVKLDANLQEIKLPPQQFNTCVTGSDVKHKKPHPDIFLRAAQRLGVSARNCLVIEDAPSGVQAAKAAGCRCLGLTTSFPAEKLLVSGADWIARDLAHVPETVLDW